MNLRICICCGEPMAEKDDALSRYANLCASCSSLLDGMSESSLSSLPAFDDKMPVKVDCSPSHGQTRQSVRPQ
jgi:hypothetical protein